MLPLPAETAHIALRALKTVARADGRLLDVERDLLSTIASDILAVPDEDADMLTLQPLAPGELAFTVEDRVHRHRILGACALMSACDGDASPDELGVIDAYAYATEIDDSTVAALQAIATDTLGPQLRASDLSALRFVLAEWQPDLGDATQSLRERFS